jgi:predicted TPR repeat methyltransferase
VCLGKQQYSHHCVSLRSFEHSLVKELGYTGYETLRRGFDRAFGGETSVLTFPVVVDAGCGTGLVGEQVGMPMLFNFVFSLHMSSHTRFRSFKIKFRNVSTHMIGVDLSQAILDEAEKLRPNLYDERIAGDITDVFRDKKPISLIVAADSYIYFGDLEPLFTAMDIGLDNNAYVAFTLENANSDDEAR